MSRYSKIRNAFSSKRLDEELAEEMRDHLVRRTEELKAQGLSDAEAAETALRQFGNPVSLREQTREMRLWTALDSTLGDIRYAWRGMRRNPAFAVAAVFSLSLAIGANTAIYSIVDAAILKPLPVPEPEQLFTLATPDIVQLKNETAGEREDWNYPVYLQLRSAAGSSARLALFGSCDRVEAQVAPGGAREKVMRQFVSGDSFAILEVPPALGRFFLPEEDRIPGAHPVAVLSYDYWHSRFGEDAAILGRSIRLEEKTYSVIGVARKGFFGIEPGLSPDVWIPAMMYNKDALTNPGWSWFRILGRLSPGTTRERLQSQLQPVIREHQKNMMARFPNIPQAIRKQFLELVLLVHQGAAGASGFRKSFARPLWTILAVAGGILLIACANIASLLLARATARSAEMAMRISLGAGRLRIVRQLLTESLLLSILAGGLGWVLARITAPLVLAALSTDREPIQLALSMNTRVLLFCAALSTIAAIFFGLIPAWQAAAAQPITALRANSGQAGKLRLGQLFVGVQVAFAFCLVVAGAGFLFSLKNLFLVDTGFDARGVSVLSISTDIPQN